MCPATFFAELVSSQAAEIITRRTTVGAARVVILNDFNFRCFPVLARCFCMRQLQRSLDFCCDARDLRRRHIMSLFPDEQTIERSRAHRNKQQLKRDERTNLSELSLPRKNKKMEFTKAR